MRRPFKRPDDDYEHRRRDPAGGSHLHGAQGYGGARSNDSDVAPPGGPWGNRETRTVRDGHVEPGAYGDRRWRSSEWDEDRYGYPEASSYAREMSRASRDYRPEGRFAAHDDRWHEGSAHWGGGGDDRDLRGAAPIPDAASGHGYGEERQGREPWRRPSSPRGAGREAEAYGRATPRAAGWQEDRGPKGYTRSDERIREDVCERLHHEAQLDVRDVSVRVQNGTVTLEGSVPERAMRHHIENICDECFGVRDIDDRIQVKRGDADRDRPDTERGAPTTGGDPNHIAGSKH